MNFGWWTLLLTLCHSVWATHAQAELSPGEVQPRLLELLVGASANITCRMNPSVLPGRTAADLYFEDTNMRRVPEAQIVRLNDTTIVYKLEHAAEQETIYRCKCGYDAINSAKVFVGKTPQPVRDFKCRNYDFQYMLCSYMQAPNPIPTQYNLSYHLHSPSYYYYPVCNYEANPLVVCNATLVDKTRSHLDDYTLHFMLRGANSQGSPPPQRFAVTLLDVTVPAAPGSQLRVVELTSDTLAVAWRMPNLDLYRAKGLQWEVLLQPDNMPAQLSTAAVVRYRGEQHLQLVHLPYAYYWYELRLRVKVRTAAAASNATDDMWSLPYTYRFRTEARLPDRPPVTSAGSFYIDSSETHLRLYWEQLEPHEYNGANFSYTVSEVRKNDEIIKLSPLHLELNSVLFAWQKNAHYEFEIRSRNHMGLSLAASRIEVFPLTQRNKRHTPPAIHNVYHANNRSYTLTWEAPAQQKDLRDYTVYWCYSKRASQNECKGSIHFQHVGAQTHRFTTAPQPVQQEQALNLAVSANYGDYNTGMHWTPCTMDENSELLKMQPEVQATGATSLKVQWGLEHICLSILNGYNLSYCELQPTEVEQLNSTAPAACQADTVRLITLDKNVRKWEITQLKPYTLYNVQMYMYSNLKKGKISDPLSRRTDEAAPEPPQHLRVGRVSNTSAIISWQPPTQTNGHIRYYTINCNNRDERLNFTDATPDARGNITYTLAGLTPFIQYEVYVTAHTVANSLHSNNVTFTTHIGVPSMPGLANPTGESYNGSTLIKWHAPAAPAGRLEYYEVAVTLMRHEQVLQRRISIVMGATECLLQVPPCAEPDFKTTLAVRAVNAALLGSEVDRALTEAYIDVAVDAADDYDDNAKLTCVGGTQHTTVQVYRNTQIYYLYKSAWQQGPTYGCAENRISKNTVIALLVVLFFLCMLGMCFVARKKYVKMANINCTLPAGLDAYLTKDDYAAAGDFLGAAAATNRDEGLRAPIKDYSYHNEKHHLLDAMGQEHSRHATLSAADDMHIPAAYLRTLSQSTTETYVDSLNEADVEMEPTQTLQRIAEDEPYVQVGGRVQAATTAMPTYVLPTAVSHSGYIQPDKIRNWAVETAAALKQQQQQQAALAEEQRIGAAQQQHFSKEADEEEEDEEEADDQQAQPAHLCNTPNTSSSGYVSVDSLHAHLPTPPKSNSNNNNGYVQPTQLQALFNAPPPAATNTPLTISPPVVATPPAVTPSASLGGGYTTLDTLSKLRGVLPVSRNGGDAAHTTPHAAICGYVTPCQLTAFGQQQQQQQQQRN